MNIARASKCIAETHPRRCRRRRSPGCEAPPAGTPPQRPTRKLDGGQMPPGMRLLVRRHVLPRLWRWLNNAPSPPFWRTGRVLTRSLRNEHPPRAADRARWTNQPCLPSLVFQEEVVRSEGSSTRSRAAGVECNVYRLLNVARGMMSEKAGRHPAPPPPPTTTYHKELTGQNSDIDASGAGSQGCALLSCPRPHLRAYFGERSPFQTFGRRLNHERRRRRTAGSRNSSWRRGVAGDRRLVTAGEPSNPKPTAVASSRHPTDCPWRRSEDEGASFQRTCHNCPHQRVTNLDARSAFGESHHSYGDCLRDELHPARAPLRGAVLHPAEQGVKIHLVCLTPDEKTELPSVVSAASAEGTLTIGTGVMPTASAGWRVMAAPTI